MDMGPKHYIPVEQLLVFRRPHVREENILKLEPHDRDRAPEGDEEHNIEEVVQLVCISIGWWRVGAWLLGHLQGEGNDCLCVIYRRRDVGLVAHSHLDVQSAHHL